jgi:hypothetical protein
MMYLGAFRRLPVKFIVTMKQLQYSYSIWETKQKYRVCKKNVLSLQFSEACRYENKQKHRTNQNDDDDDNNAEVSVARCVPYHEGVSRQCRKLKT